MPLNKAEILNEMRLKTELVEISKGKEVIVSEIGAADYIKLWTSTSGDKDGHVDMAEFSPKLVAFCVVDEKGERIFSEDDIPALIRSSNKVFEKLAEVARRLNGISGEEAKN